MDISKTIALLEDLSSICCHVAEGMKICGYKICDRYKLNNMLEEIVNSIYESMEEEEDEE